MNPVEELTKVSRLIGEHDYKSALSKLEQLTSSQIKLTLTQETIQECEILIRKIITLCTAATEGIFLAQKQITEIVRMSNQLETYDDSGQSYTIPSFDLRIGTY